MSTEYHGPFQDSFPYRITVDGYEIPLVRGRKNVDGNWEFLLDGRFSWTANEQEIQQWMWILANAMAIGAGYTHFGENSKKNNPYTRRLVGVILDGDEQSIQFIGGEIGSPENDDNR